MVCLSLKSSNQPSDELAASSTTTKKTENAFSLQEHNPWPTKILVVTVQTIGMNEQPTGKYPIPLATVASGRTVAPDMSAQASVDTADSSGSWL
jgi:hypothetical protein